MSAAGEPAAREPTARESGTEGTDSQETAAQKAATPADTDPGAQQAGPKQGVLEQGVLEKGEPQEGAPQEAAPEEAAPQEAAPEDDEPPKPLAPWANTAVALTVIALGVAGAAGSWALGPGTPADPGSGTWPLLVSVAIAALGTVLLGLARRTADTEVFSASSWKVLAGIATMVGFVAVVGVIGFEIPSALLAFVWLRFLGGESWRLSAIASVLIVVAFYTVFVGLLAVPIPHLF
ncbi:tripartite tricarboxylate transporter TctB family protein [Nocardiopsis alborubida]|uniref:tripartite tricarboxylate transporter TctB family protein n=1 Tax=Nocardiopsis alborubida TaxID=146802 RepID=UPI000A63774B|nr:tripartite tricarboxylate transporter TctB family protein [Nocardiopsis alborubida]